MNINSPMAFTGLWAGYTSASLGTSSARPTPVRRKTPQSSWQAPQPRPGRTRHGERFALYYTAQGKRETVLGESEWRARVAGVLRELPHRHPQPGDPGRGSYASALPSGDVGSPKEAGASEEAGSAADSLGADKAYGSGEFLAWLLARGIEPHIPVIDCRHQTRGRFTREQFRHEPTENTYYCPEGKLLRYRGLQRGSRGYAYCSTAAQCQGCPQKKQCTPAAYRKLFAHWQEPARQAVRALAGTPA